MIPKWLKDYIKKNKETAWKEGYNWAAGALLRGEETPISIEAYTYNNNKEAFDFGSEEAVNKLIELNIILDDRI